ncbi:MAG: PIN domain-containing protein [Nonlabens sp.]|uniref:PIN domain-containing protein n=1 Tax=Nonlabens sp. TaxID=1888209 RepID=UPI00321A999D
MKDRSFIDSNIFIYTLNKSEDIRSEKSKQTLSLLQKESRIVISTQVIQEISNVCIKKHLLDKNDLLDYVNRLTNLEVAVINENIIKEAIRIKFRYQLSFYDSLIVATAIENNCSRLYSEDLNNGQSIEGLQIINPFQEN